MNKTTYAKIKTVQVYHDTQWDSETNQQITIKSYSFTYEYSIDGQIYKGSGNSKLKKREGQSVKIYYNEMKPVNSETAEEHNSYLRIFIFIIAIFIIVFWLMSKSN